MKTPVAFLIFNRPDTSRRVFQAIRQAKPPQLLVVADGPRFGKVGEVEKCQATRSIIDGVDWNCEVLTNYSEINLGCKKRVASGLDWVFNTVEEAIVLEDDCVPHPTFFRFCEELLHKYRKHEKIMAICGTNTEEMWKATAQSYHFSHYGNIWGWASWRRAWSHYDIDMKLWSKPEIREKIKHTLGDEQQYQIRQKRFSLVHSGKVDTWDVQLLFAFLRQSGLFAVPAVNLVSNIGFGKDATHTNDSNNELANLPVNAMSFPLQEPDEVVVDREFDDRVYQKLFKKKSLPRRVWRKIQYLIATGMAT